MSSPIHIIALILPTPGNTARVISLLQSIMISNVWDKEPTTSRYHLHKQIGGTDGSEEIVMVETYDSKKDAEAHLVTPYFKELGQKFQDEGLLKEAPKIVQCVSVAGFESRGEGLVSKI